MLFVLYYTTDGRDLLALFSVVDRTFFFLFESPHTVVLTTVVKNHKKNAVKQSVPQSFQVDSGPQNPSTERRIYQQDINNRWHSCSCGISIQRDIRIATLLNCLFAVFTR
ncbi:hypothetical protein B9Z55_024459 [Caenorhabditis nigoni]|uniref:Uncharacterized protein n=1 Tax=Caenorhabditis nigoni TaxID=1611254 RepID=A0A2G5SU19_9PELO|nr:hypothetical protein B9Z55_024459 [Caenorhabditis nigoni]